MLFEDNAQVLYSVVLRVANQAGDQRITGIETLVDRITPNSRFKPDSLEKPLPGMSALVTFEAFKVWSGEIHAINAFFRILPKETQRGWPSAE